MADLSVADIARRLAVHAEDVCRELLPCGRRVGNEWRCGSINGEPGDSLGIHLFGKKAGIWSDFAGTPGNGGDLIDLIEKVEHLKARYPFAAALLLGIVLFAPDNIAKKLGFDATEPRRLRSEIGKKKGWESFSDSVLSPSILARSMDEPFFLYFAHMYVHLPLYAPERFLKQSENGSYGAAVECIDWCTGVILQLYDIVMHC